MKQVVLLTLMTWWSITTLHAQQDTVYGKWLCLQAKTPAGPQSLAAFYLADTLHHLRDDQHYPAYTVLKRTGKTYLTYDLISYTNGGGWQPIGEVVLRTDIKRQRTQLQYAGRRYTTTQPALAGSLQAGQPCFVYSSSSLQQLSVELVPIMPPPAASPAR